MSASFESLVNAHRDRCLEKARRLGGVWCVVIMDHWDDRVVMVIPEPETYGDEWDAFRGRVLFSSDEV